VKKRGGGIGQIYNTGRSYPHELKGLLHNTGN